MTDMDIGSPPRETAASGSVSRIHAMPTLNDFNTTRGFAWKVAQPINFPGLEHISQYYKQTLLDYPIFFSDLPDTSDEPYIPSYKYLAFVGREMDENILKTIRQIKLIIDLLLKSNSFRNYMHIYFISM